LRVPITRRAFTPDPRAARRAILGTLSDNDLTLIASALQRAATEAQTTGQPVDDWTRLERKIRGIIGC